MALIRIFQEWIGYCLTNETHLEKAALLIGNGANGKTVSTNLIHNLLGPLAIADNVHELGRPGNYAVARLPGARVVISTESSKGAGFQESLIRRLISGELMPARHIYGRPFEFTPVCKLMWSMNDKPQIHDTSDAIWRRLLIFPFNRTFTDEDKDPRLLEKLIPELPGIFNWALEGLARLRAMGGFSEANASTEALDEYRRESNPVLQWREEHTINLDAPMTKASELYSDYSQWAENNGRGSLNSTNFGRELKRLPEVEWKPSNYVYYNLGLLSEKNDD